MTQCCQCFFCARLDQGAPLVAVCAAYPEGIPDTILRNEVDHRQPQPGDHGLQFEPARGIDPHDVRFLLDHHFRQKTAEA